MDQINIILVYDNDHFVFNKLQLDIRPTLLLSNYNNSIQIKNRVYAFNHEDLPAHFGSIFKQ